MKIKPIILASGFGRRFGENKLLTPINAKPMFLHLVDKLYSLNKKGLLESPLVITKYLDIINILEQKNIQYALNPDANKGMSSSIKTGLSHLEKESIDYYFFFNADQPYLEEKTIESFVLSYVESKKPLGCFLNKDALGSPAIFHKNFRPELMALCGDVGGKKILIQHKDQAFLYPSYNNELKDIDFLNDMIQP